MAYIPPTNPLRPDKPKRRPYRPTAKQLGYDQNHKIQRRQVMLEAGGICEMCQNAFAEELDHKDGSPKNKERDNVWALCKPCHRAKTLANRKQHGHG